MISAEAEKRARAWLLEHLDEDQRQELERTSCFTVISQYGNRYRIDTTKRQMNVFLTWRDGAQIVLCVITKDHQVPLYDQCLMQKLMLEAKEDEFMKVALPSSFPRSAGFVHEHDALRHFSASS